MKSTYTETVWPRAVGRLALRAGVAALGLAVFSDALAAAALPLAPGAAGEGGPAGCAAAIRAPAAAAAGAFGAETGRATFASYRKAVAAAARAAGDREQARRVEALASGRAVPAEASPLASCLLRGYLLARYGKVMVSDLQALVGFRTFASPGEESWSAPEFLRQRRWLELRAGELGLTFHSYDGRVEVVALPGPKSTLALLTHGDVQGVEGQQWSSPPWEGRLQGERLIGRGAEDDKGPLVAALYTLAALRDAGWPLGATVQLLIANAEESSWNEIPYFLARAPMPDSTVGLDAAYPVTYAQKGYGEVVFRAGAVASPRGGRFRIVRLSGGSGLSIIPERGEALFAAVAGKPPASDSVLPELSTLAARWSAGHPPARLEVKRQGELLQVVARGRGGHSAEPASGHNALGDLTAFLATLDLSLDRWGALAAFVGIAVGTETDGQSLGIARRDPEMGPLTTSLAFLQEDGGTPVARLNLRVPRGITRQEMERRIGERVIAFARRSGASITAAVELQSEPHYVSPHSELIGELLAAWREVTGRAGRPVAIGGATQASLFRGGVDFGPAEDMAAYRGHGADEYLTIPELHRIAELTAAAVWRLANRR